MLVSTRVHTYTVAAAVLLCPLPTATIARNFAQQRTLGRV